MCNKLTGVLYYLVLLKVNSSRKCDTSLGSLQIHEGILGQVNTFPWHGILKVYIRDVGSVTEALTGIVLVKKGYAIANADEIAKIPKRIFKRDSQAMFLPENKEPWYCSLRNYLTHPEYQFYKLNSIALIDLDMGDRRLIPILPVCWPPYSYNTSDDLYTVGYTDDRGPLEKFFHKMKYLDLKLCNDFYNETDLADEVMVPVNYNCAYAKNLNQSCVWDTGMALISNVTGYWVLVGFGVRGPGCSAPARFVDLTTYFSWIEHVTKPANTTMRTAFGEGFNSRRQANNKDPKDLVTSWSYPFDTETHQYEYFIIDRIEKDFIKIIPTEGSWKGKCDPLFERLLYREDTKIDKRPYVTLYNNPVPKISAAYRLSLYDLHFYNYTCASVKINSPNQSEATLYYRTSIENKEGTALSRLGDTPEEVIKITPIRNRTAEDIQTAAGFKPSSKLRPASITDPTNYYKFQSINLHFTFEFFKSASFSLKIYGYPNRHTSVTHPTTEKAKYTKMHWSSPTSARTRRRRTKTKNRKFFIRTPASQFLGMDYVEFIKGDKTNLTN